MICMRVTLTVSCCTQGCAGSEEKNNSQNADSERAKVVDDKGAAVNDSSNTYISATVGLKEGTSYADMKDFFAKEVDGCPPLPLLPFVSILLCLLHPTTASTSQCPALLIVRLNRWNSPLSPLPTACSASTSPLGTRPPQDDARPSSAVIASEFASPVCRVLALLSPFVLVECGGGRRGRE